MIAGGNIASKKLTCRGSMARYIEGTLPQWFRLILADSVAAKRFIYAFVSLRTRQGFLFDVQRKPE